VCGTQAHAVAINGSSLLHVFVGNYMIGKTILLPLDFFLLIAKEEDDF
jgi:hypothetical protein